MTKGNDVDPNQEVSLPMASSVKKPINARLARAEPCSECGAIEFFRQSCRSCMHLAAVTALGFVPLEPRQ